MLVLTRSTIAATSPVLFASMATPSAGCARGPRCQNPRPSPNWSVRLESTSARRSSFTLLDGGLAKWTSGELPLSDEAPAHEPRTFAARLVEGIYCSLDQAKASVDDDDVMAWDVRSVGEFEGTTKGWNAPPRLGHLPGAIHLEWAELFDSDDGTLKPADEINTLLGAKGITPQATVFAY